jgi:hypothetical protein
MKKYFKRPHLDQYWCTDENGDTLLINYKEPGKVYKYHYDGDGHIFFKKEDSFDRKQNAIPITRHEWLKVRTEHLKRLKQF